MNREIANETITLAAAARAETWHTRRPSEEMKKRFGDVGAFVECPRPGKGYAQEVLAQDYEGDDVLREMHLDFVQVCATNASTMAKQWLVMQTALMDIGNLIGGPTMAYSAEIEREELLARVRKVAGLVQKGLAAE